MREAYLLDLVLSVYDIYLPRLRDAKGRALLQTYLKGERFRASQIEQYLGRQGLDPSPLVRRLFRVIGRIYGRLTALLGTRLMLRIVLSASQRAARTACRDLGVSPPPARLYLATLQARHEGDLAEGLRQHLIETRPRNGRS
jgi:hypothetical protein